MKIREVVIQKTSIKDPRHGETKGKAWTMYPVGIQVREGWYNGAFFNIDDLEEFKKIEAGQKRLVLFFKKSYKGKDGEQKSSWNFRWPKVEEENNYLLKEIIKLLEKR